jgi:hypothetical protein
MVDYTTILFPFNLDKYKKSIEEGQIEVNNIQEAYANFKQANFLDCRINAYPAYTRYRGINSQPPNFVMCDLDVAKFRIGKLLLQTLQKTTETNRWTGSIMGL